MMNPETMTTALYFELAASLQAGSHHAVGIADLNDEAEWARLERDGELDRWSAAWRHRRAGRATV